MILLLLGWIGCAWACAWVAYEGGKTQGWIDCEDYYKPMLDRCRKYDAKGGEGRKP